MLALVLTNPPAGQRKNSCFGGCSVVDQGKPPLRSCLVECQTKDRAGRPAQRRPPHAKPSAVERARHSATCRADDNFAEASHSSLNLVVREVTQAKCIVRHPGCIAEVGLSLGTTVSVEAPDTV